MNGTPSKLPMQGMECLDARILFKYCRWCSSSPPSFQNSLQCPNDEHQIDSRINYRTHAILGPYLTRGSLCHCVNIGTSIDGSATLMLNVSLSSGRNLV